MKDYIAIKITNCLATGGQVYRVLAGFVLQDWDFVFVIFMTSLSIMCMTNQVKSLLNLKISPCPISLFIRNVL